MSHHLEAIGPSQNADCGFESTRRLVLLFADRDKYAVRNAQVETRLAPSLRPWAMPARSRGPAMTLAGSSAMFRSKQAWCDAGSGERNTATP